MAYTYRFDTTDRDYCRDICVPVGSSSDSVHYFASSGFGATDKYYRIQVSNADSESNGNGGSSGGNGGDSSSMATAAGNPYSIVILLTGLCLVSI